MFKICIVIPCYNEAERLQVKKFRDFLQNHSYFSFCFVNDGSKDNTLHILENFQSENPDIIHIVDVKPNKGKAEAVRYGFLEMFKKEDFDYIGFLDADLATPLSELLNFEKYIIKFPNKEVFLGSRIRRLGATIDRSAKRHFLGRIFATVASIMLKLNVYDTQCGAKIFKVQLAKQVFQQKFFSKWLFDIELLFRIVNLYGIEKSIQILYEIPLNDWAEIGNSKISFSDMLKVPFELMKINNYYKKIV